MSHWEHVPVRGRRCRGLLLEDRRVVDGEVSWESLSSSSVLLGYT